MKLMLERLSADWQARWANPLALVETFVDPRSTKAPPTRSAAGHGLIHDSRGGAKFSQRLARKPTTGSEFSPEASRDEKPALPKARPIVG